MKSRHKERDFIPFPKPGDSLKNAKRKFQKHGSEMYFKVWRNSLKTTILLHMIKWSGLWANSILAAKETEYQSSASQNPGPNYAFT